MTGPIEGFRPEVFSNFRIATKNYLTGLNIPSDVKPDFLIVTDRSPNLLGRQVLANNLALLVGQEYPASKRSYLSFSQDEKPEVVQKLIEKKMKNSDKIIAILLSGGHPWRFGVYDAVEKEIGPNGKVIRYAYSPGLTASDAFVLEQMDNAMQLKIIEAVEKRARWFQEKRTGELTIKTGGNQQHSLSLHFNMDKAPVISSTGFLSDKNLKGNIPSGEAHLVPYPFNQSNGEIETTSGLVIKVENGLATFIDVSNVNNKISDAEKKLVDLVNSRSADDEGIPLSELGLGVLEGLGIKTKEDEKDQDGQMSILTKEKLKLHMGFGVIAGKSTEELAIKDKLKKGQSHTDVLLENATILFENKEVLFE